jgi:hypothetical protein
LKVHGLANNNNNPVVERDAKETDNRIKNGAITVTAPASPWDENSNTVGSKKHPSEFQRPNIPDDSGIPQ